MKEPREDDERLSALLEGRVEGRQREDLLAHLAEADDDYEVFTNTAAVLRALEEEDARARRPVAPPSMRRRGWPSARTVAAVAGTVVLLLAAGWLFRERGGSAAGDPLRLAARVDVDTASWSPWRPQGNMRGGDERATREARAVYAGAGLVDLAVAVRIGDTAWAGEWAATLQNQLDARTNPHAPLSRIAARSDAPADSLNALIAQATKEYAELDRNALELGAWIEAARLAARARDADFFAKGATLGMLRRAERQARGDRDAEAAVEAVRMARPRNGAANWDMLARHLETMLARLAHMGAPSASA